MSPLYMKFHNGDWFHMRGWELEPVTGSGVSHGFATLIGYRETQRMVASPSRDHQTIAYKVAHVPSWLVN